MPYFAQLTYGLLAVLAVEDDLVQDGQEPCETGLGEPSPCFGRTFPSRVCVRARAALTR